MDMVRLDSSYDERVMNLFCDCFKDDHYYADIFPDKRSRKKKMKESFYGIIKYCTKNGLSFGITDNDQLVAFVLCFNYQEARKNERLFNEIFIGKDRVAKYENEIHSVLKPLSNVIYLLSIAVHEKWRRRNIASSMVDRLLYEYRKKYRIASDVSNKLSLPMYKHKDFKIKEIEDDYYLVVR